MSSASRRRAALAKYRSARETGTSALDQIEFEDDAIYDEVTEEEYRQTVQARREREDFVVDDDGLGYYDDGEERFGEEAEYHEQQKKQSRSNNAALTEQALKKARQKSRALQNSTTVAGNSSMWNFVNRGASTTSVSAQQQRKAVPNVDDLLAELDDPTVLRSKPPSRPAHRSSSRTMPHRRPVVAAPPSSHAAPPPAPKDFPYNSPPENDDDDDAPMVHFNDDDNNDDMEPVVTTPEAKKPEVTSTPKSVQFAPDTKGDDDIVEEPEPKKRRFVRSKLSISTAAQKALETKEAMEKTVQQVPSTLPMPVEPVMEEPSPTHLPRATATLEQVVQTNEHGEKYLDLFWTDLAERNGDILLFGKVPAPNDQFVSACVHVTGITRSLYCLPRQQADGTPYPMLEVHQEINNMLMGNVIPNKAGASWAGKTVQRKYAFDDSTIPRESTEYLKIVYAAQYPPPPEERCQGKTYSHILNTTASIRETFILNCQLMGPCWVRIQDCQPTRAPLSYAKVECVVASPKQVHRVTENVPPPPPVTTVTLQFKTAVNPTTQKSEIVVAAALCHNRVMLETATEATPEHQSALVIVRPWQQPSLPRDFRASGVIRQEQNERALISRLMAQLLIWDPDCIVGHNAAGFDLEVLLMRCTELKISTWAQLGRRRRTGAAFQGKARKDYAIQEALVGRLLCDTYLSAKELLRETTYSLTNLAETQLKQARREIEAVDVPAYFQSGATVTQLAMTTLHDAQLVQGLLFKLQVLPLTKQLTCIAGNIWSHTLRGNRAERTEYLLLHEFHRLKFIPPEKQKKSVTTNKAKYSGGLVLEPKKGLYDSFILLLDFNSLYPSIIQEYNLCFTTIDWSKHIHDDEAPIPDAQVERGVLPTVIQTLVDRRRNVKKILKSETDPSKKEELDIRQKALKLTANSMYGCLGFSNSRFFAQPIAALVTAKGRDTLQRTVDIAQNSVGLDVIYGDTDSIMINTRLKSEQDLPKVRQLGELVKKQVNRQYRTLELEIDGIFRSMLLLKKKKYAAKTVEELPDGTIKYGEELKGLDLVRRDWCVQSKETGKYITSQILSGEDSEVVLHNIHAHLEKVAEDMRAGALPLEKYVITKGLSKHPNDYPDAKSLPHVLVAKEMLRNNRPVNTGDHIPYVITAPIEEVDEEGRPKPTTTSPIERARHPEEIVRSNGVLKPDVEWYLSMQILPPIARLCDPIEGTSQQILAAKLHLDVKRYGNSSYIDGRDNTEEDVDMNFRPSSLLSDVERFKDVEKLRLFCFACGQENEFPGVLYATDDKVGGTQQLASGFTCTNPSCVRPNFWGQKNLFECCSRIMNATSIWTRGLMTKYYDGVVRCDEPSCGLETRQLSVAGGVCLRRGCNGLMTAAVTERTVHTHLKYLESLFDVEHTSEQLAKNEVFGAKIDIMKSLSKIDANAFELLHGVAKARLERNAFNWIPKDFWAQMFNIGKAKQ
ncbi:DNA polymerase alpha subunit A [Fistulifera solaris]|uniref:DNA polymerase n=1 Tax=Fistulifera solaris TaxID=1519565 RepID=A0A1Z5JVV8_FISSO|nr:DNA polymerase alpha subunit A [Fistulifera solaris]|eukprot:GAX18016.1 DNA polymerase alpha subunit A [Fistulifera solaris]